MTRSIVVLAGALTLTLELYEPVNDGGELICLAMGLARQRRYWTRWYRALAKG